MLSTERIKRLSRTSPHSIYYGTFRRSLHQSSPTRHTSTNSRTSSAGSCGRRTVQSACMILGGVRTGPRCSRQRMAAGVCGSRVCCGAALGEPRGFLPFPPLVVLWSRANEMRVLSTGNGQHFPRNPRADEMLARLAQELVKLEQD